MSNNQELVPNNCTGNPTTAMSAPFVSAEEEVATSFVIEGGQKVVTEEQVYYLHDDGIIYLRNGDELIEIGIHEIPESVRVVAKSVDPGTEIRVVQNFEPHIEDEVRGSTNPPAENMAHESVDPESLIKTQESVNSKVENITDESDSSGAITTAPESVNTEPMNISHESGCPEAESINVKNVPSCAENVVQKSVGLVNENAASEKVGMANIAVDPETREIEGQEPMDQSSGETSIPQHNNNTVEPIVVSVKRHTSENVPCPGSSTAVPSVQPNYILPMIGNIVMTEEKAAILKKNQENMAAGSNVLIPIPGVSPETCEYCLRKLSNQHQKQRHVCRVHRIMRGSVNLKCLECGSMFYKSDTFRAHLSSQHGIDMSIQRIKLKDKAAFKKWKSEIEKKTMSYFTLRQRYKLQEGEKYIYRCHRAGIYQSTKGVQQHKRLARLSGATKLGIVCTAAMYLEENKDGLYVEYCPHHYGHGREMTSVQLSTEEHNAIQEKVATGVPFERMLDEIRDDESVDQCQLYFIKKNDIKLINNAYACEEYNPGLSDAQSVDRWVRLCCQMEDSPILFYTQEEAPNVDFLLVIMTEFQKQILLASDKQVICVDSCHRQRKSRFYLTCISIIDEYENAFPVAFCISHKLDKHVVTQFYTSIKESTGPLSCTCFMSNKDNFFYDTWVDVMEDHPSWLWSLWYVDYRIRAEFSVFKGDIRKRRETYKKLRLLLQCQDQTIFDTMYRNILEALDSEPRSKPLANFISKRYGSCKELWAVSYRSDIKFGTIVRLEVLHRTLKFCCKEGRKKRLDKFIIVLMKLVRYKMLDRLNSDLDEDKVKLVMEAINKCHNIGLEIPTENISSLSDKIWLIHSEEEEENVYVTQDLTICPEHCLLKCSECGVCVHMFSCSCMHSMINANLCHHIHAVVWKFLTPHFSPPSSPIDNGVLDEEMENRETSVNLNANPEKLIDTVLKQTHELYKKIRCNKNDLNKESLTAISKRLKESFDIAMGKKVSETPDVCKNPVIIVNPFNPAILQNQTPLFKDPQSHLPIGIPIHPHSILSQSKQPKIAQPTRFVLPNQIQNMLTKNGQSSEYVLLLPEKPGVNK